MWSDAAPPDGGEGGFPGMNNDGIVATEEMIEMYRIMFGMSDGLLAQKGEMS